MPKYSVIVPVYNRPQAVNELLESLTHQGFRDFEVLIVEDGSTLRCDTVVYRYRDTLAIQYFFKPNSGPGPSRNFGYARARGNYFVVFDSDCIIPPAYFEAVEKGLRDLSLDAWGGPDKPREDFTLLQRAMGYTMSSILTTGGIRGGGKKIGWFQPRGFNMGISRRVYEATGGFKFDRFAEDIEFSIRIKKAGFRVDLIPDAFVYHRRRATFAQFYRQVFDFGKGRALVGKAHPSEVKLTHWFPVVFMIGTVLVFVLPLVSALLFRIALGCFLTYLLAIFFHSLKTNRNLMVALLSIPSALLQLSGYGLGFLSGRFKLPRITRISLI